MIGPHKLSPGLLVDALSKRRDQKMKRPGQKEQTKVVDSREGSCVLATGSLEPAAWWQRIDIERREQFHGKTKSVQVAVRCGRLIDALLVVDITNIIP